MNGSEQTMDMNAKMMLDGNAVAGTLQAIFGVDMTSSSLICAHCGIGNLVGGLRAFTQSPGIVLRCPGCEQVMLRIVHAQGATLLDARGVMYLKIPG